MLVILNIGNLIRAIYEVINEEIYSSFFALDILVIVLNNKIL